MSEHVVRQDQGGVVVERDGEPVAPGLAGTVHLHREIGKPVRIEIEFDSITSRTIELVPFVDSVRIVGWGRTDHG